MQFKFLIITTFMVALLLGCQTNDTPQAEEAQIGHQAVVKEVIQANSYTYLCVDEAGKELWIATGKRDMEEGTTIYYNKGLEMKDFHSKDLDRTFESLIMVQNISLQPLTAPKMMGNMMEGQKPKLSKEDVSVAKTEGGVTIGELYENMKAYANKTVTVRGKVMKFNAQIMNRNWVHIQDGTGGEDSFDLTVTTDHVVKKGDEVTFTGVISLDRDFGAGYSYDIIMEKATVSR